MDLDRIANISLEDNPWRPHDQNQQPWSGGGSGAGGGAMPGGAGAPGTWGTMSPHSQPMRNNPWHEPVGGSMGDGLGGQNAGGSWGAPMGGAPGDFGEAAKIWSDPHAEQPPFQHMHAPHGINGGMMDGGGGGGGGDWMGAPGQSQPLWADPKQDQDYWKHQQQSGGWGGPQPGMQAGGWAPRQIHPNAPPPPQHGVAPRPPIMYRPPGPSGGGWQPNGMMGGAQGAKQQQYMRHDMVVGMPGGPGMGRGGPPGRGAPPGRYSGVDMSVPPPIDMPPGAMGMRGMPGPGQQHQWKQQQQQQQQQDQLVPNGMRGGGGAGGAMPPYGGQQQMQPFDAKMPQPFGMPGGNGGGMQAPGQFPIAGADDLMWHDPNGDLKKWQRDTGVSLWGDPEKCNERPVRLWQVPEGEEEDLEIALAKCPVPQKKNEDGTPRLPFPLPSKRPIVVTGWGELPENDPNNPSKPDEMPSTSKWSEVPGGVGGDAAPWYLPGQAGAPFSNEPTAWGQPPTQPPVSGTLPFAAPPPGHEQPHMSTQAIADQLKYAVDKGYLDFSILTQNGLPPPVLYNMNQLLAKIPQLETVEAELKALKESVIPEGELDQSSPQRWMNDVQTVDHNRLIIEVTTAKIEVQELSKKIQRALSEHGVSSAPQGGDPMSGQDYHYSFLE